MKGIFEFEIGEPKVKRGFKFGTYAFAIACEKDDCPLNVLLQRIGVGADEVSINKVNVMTLLRVFYGAAVHYAEHVKQPADFSQSDVSDWVDELGLERINEILTNGLSQYVPKNSNSPTETGEKVIQ
jgi:hypothetical protein